MTRNLTCFDVEVGRPAHPNLCFEKGEGNVENNLVKRSVGFQQIRDTNKICVVQ